MLDLGVFNGGGALAGAYDPDDAWCRYNARCVDAPQTGLPRATAEYISWEKRQFDAFHAIGPLSCHAVNRKKIFVAQRQNTYPGKSGNSMRFMRSDRFLVTL